MLEVPLYVETLHVSAADTSKQASDSPGLSLCVSPSGGVPSPFAGEGARDPAQLYSCACAAGCAKDTVVRAGRCELHHFGIFCPDFKPSSHANKPHPQSAAYYGAGGSVASQGPSPSYQAATWKHARCIHLEERGSDRRQARP
jgi:hypothetical protein